MKLPILWEVTLCCCASSFWCFRGLECPFIRSSIATKDTLGLRNTILGKLFTWWLNVIFQKTWIFNKIWCSVVLQLLIELFVMNVLEIAYICFLKNYKTCIWVFETSGMLNLYHGGMVPYLLKQHTGFILNHKFNMKKSPLSRYSVHSFKTLHCNHMGM
jgi:hypothetical protein